MRTARRTIFQVRCETPWGAEVRVVGSSESLGRWDPTRGFRLDTGPRLYPAWRSRSSILLEDGEVEFKYVIVTRGEEVIWECCNNRCLPALEDEVASCQAILIQNSFHDGSFARYVQMRPFPDRRALMHLRRGHRLGLAGFGIAKAGHEEPTGSKYPLEGLDIDGFFCDNNNSTASGLSGITRASSTDSLTLFEEVDDSDSRSNTLIVLPQSAGRPGCSASFVEIFGSFTHPAWANPVQMHFCPETALWWISLEEALPQLQPGSYEFKFHVNGHIWVTNPAMPEIPNVYGCTNNKLFIDYRLLTSIERTASKQRSAPGVSFLDPQSRRSDSLKEDDTVSAPVANSSLPRRTISTVDRLHREGSDSPPQGNPIRKQSLPCLMRTQHSTPNMTIHHSIANSPRGMLYDRDVALLLELPNLKRNSDLSLVAGAFSKPKDGAGDGEDSHFVSTPAMGVADGVGGLKEVLGYTSKEFSDDLMAGCQKTAQSLPLDVAVPSRRAACILQQGYTQVTKHGAATAVIAHFESAQNRLGIAGLGDSGVMVVRRPTVQDTRKASSSVRSTRSYIVFKSPPQQHDFNYPYQLCSLPKRLKKRFLQSSDQPSDCFTFDVTVEEGDLILVYSDGVEDNLHDQELLDICDCALSPYAVHILGLTPEAASPPELVAKAIGTAAYAHSIDEAARTPFSEEARKAGWPVCWCVGGKEDDITCVAAWVSYKKSGEA